MLARKSSTKQQIIIFFLLHQLFLSTNSIATNGKNYTGICDIGSPTTDCTITTPQIVYCNAFSPNDHKKNPISPFWNICNPDPLLFKGNLIFQGNGSLTCEPYCKDPSSCDGQIQPWVYKDTHCSTNVDSNSRNVPSLCELKINVLKDFTMTDNAIITSNSIIINVTGSISMAVHTALNATARGIPSLPTNGGLGELCKPYGQPTQDKEGVLNSYGASHAGSGGIGGDYSTVLKTTPISYTSLAEGNSGGKIIGNVSYFPFDSEDSEWGYSGVRPGFLNGDSVGAGIGGGRIHLMTTGEKSTITMNGGVFARGSDAYKGNGGKTEIVNCCGAGSGGTIQLTTTQIIGTGLVSTTGGNAVSLTLSDKTKGEYLRGAGGGGRILYNLTHATSKSSGDVTLVSDSNGGIVPASTSKTTTKTTNNLGEKSVRLTTATLEELTGDVSGYGQGAPGTILKNIVGYSAELDVWGNPPSLTNNKMLAITPVVIHSQERISVFNIGNSQKLFANVLSNAIRMCDVEQYCNIQESSQSNIGLYINPLGTLQYIQPNIGDSQYNTMQVHALVVDGCLEYEDDFVMDIQVGLGGFSVGGTSKGRFSFGAGTVRITSHGVIDISGDMGRDAATCLSSNARARDALNSKLKSGTSSAVRLELRTLTDMNVGSDSNGADITVDMLTLLSKGTLTVGGHIDPGSSQTQCLQGVTDRQMCSDILLPSGTIDKKFDTIGWPNTNFTVVIGVTGPGRLVVSSGSQIVGDRLLLCSDNGTIVIDGTVDASGQGCGAGSGGTSDNGASPFPNGGGLCDSTNYGGGGAHYGSGGNGCKSTSAMHQAHLPLQSFWKEFGQSSPHCPLNRVVLGGAKWNDVPGYGPDDEPLVSGAGGGCASPQGSNGNGGGVVVVHGARLCLGTGGCNGKDLPATLLATGKSGANGGGGGGAGGSITIEVDNLESSPSSQTSVQGGSGTVGKLTGAGGGGGGGRLFVVVPRVSKKKHLTSSDSNQSPSPSTHNNPVCTGPFCNFHANVSVTGGYGMYYNGSGWKGHLDSKSCPKAHGLQRLYNAHTDPSYDQNKYNKLKCVPCSEGTFQNQTGEECQNCIQGTYQNLTGQSECFNCPSNSFCLNEGCPICEVCKAGNYTNSSISSCKSCPVCIGQTSKNNSDNILCRPKEHAFFCTPSISKDGTKSCTPAGSLPSMHIDTPSASSSNFDPSTIPQPVVGSRACSYNCDPGYVKNAGCITPFALFLESVGGWWGFVGGILGASFLFALTFGVVCKRVEGCTIYQQRQRFIRLEGLQRMPGSPFQTNHDRSSTIDPGGMDSIGSRGAASLSAPDSPFNSNKYISDGEMPLINPHTPTNLLSSASRSRR